MTKCSECEALQRDLDQELSAHRQTVEERDWARAHANELAKRDARTVADLAQRRRRILDLEAALTKAYAVVFADKERGDVRVEGRWIERAHFLADIRGVLGSARSRACNQECDFECGGHCGMASGHEGKHHCK